MPNPIVYDNPQQRFIIYCNQQFGANTVTGCSMVSASDDATTGISYGNADAATQKAVVNIAVKTPDVFGGWAPLPIPDTDGFLHDVIKDPNLPQYPMALLMALLAAHPSLSYADRKAFLGQATGWITSAYPSQGQAVIDQINTYATERAVPIK